MLALIIPFLANLVKVFTNGDAAAAAWYVGLFGLIVGLTFVSGEA